MPMNLEQPLQMARGLPWITMEYLIVFDCAFDVTESPLDQQMELDPVVSAVFSSLYSGGSEVHSPQERRF